MEILNRFFKKKNKFVHPPPSVMENPDNSDKEVFGKAVIEKMDGRSYYSTWFNDPASSTGRRYRVQVSGEVGTFTGGGETLAMAISKANKEYDKKVK